MKILTFLFISILFFSNSSFAANKYLLDGEWVLDKQTNCEDLILKLTIKKNRIKAHKLKGKVKIKKNRLTLGKDLKGTFSSNTSLQLASRTSECVYEFTKELDEDEAESFTLDSNITIDGRWRGIVVCDWDKENWGGGEYKLGNGKLTGKIDFIVNNGTIKAGNRNYPGRGRFWNDWSGGGHKIQSFKISKQKITIESKTPHDGHISNWEANLTSNNTMKIN